MRLRWHEIGILGWTAAALWIGGCAKSYTSAADGGVNRPPDGSPGSGAIGDPCTSSSECESGLCLSVGAEFLCSMPCGPCPEGTICEHVEPSSAPEGEDVPEAGYYCLPDRLGLCQPCENKLDCPYPADDCITLGDGTKVCGQDCSYDQTCPDGYTCQDGQCRPIGDTCDCTADRVGAKRRCEISNDYGTCYGVETCYIAGWEGCDAREPAPEACNGVDDDCDGQLLPDEVDSDGNGVLDCKENCQPSAEVCDGEDNDCNGLVDDGGPEALCGEVPNGHPKCEDAHCVIDTCNDGFLDLNGDFSDGCECQVPETGGPSCDQAEDLGAMNDSGQRLVVRGILQEGQEAWFRVYAVDSDDAPGPSCDTFHFRAYFTENPGDAYRLFVLDGSCDATGFCDQAGTDFEWYTNYREGSGESALGECDCLADPTVNGDGYNQCTDNSRVFYIQVVRQPNTTVTCESFQVEISNGVYTP